MSLLELSDVRKTYSAKSGDVKAVDGVSLTLEPGDFVAVQGPSGCGKSTLLLLAGGLLAPDSGRVAVANEPVYEFGADARSRFRASTIGFVFQQFHLIPYLTVLDNVLAPAIAAGEQNARDRAQQLIERLGLKDRERHVPAELSSGERQRTALARALLNSPKLILADEPTGNLQQVGAGAVLDHLREFANDGGVALLVTHDPQAAARADRSIRLRAGQIESP